MKRFAFFSVAVFLSLLSPGAMGQSASLPAICSQLLSGAADASDTDQFIALTRKLIDTSAITTQELEQILKESGVVNPVAAHDTSNGSPEVLFAYRVAFERLIGRAQLDWQKIRVTLRSAAGEAEAKRQARNEASRETVPVMKPFRLNKPFKEDPRHPYLGSRGVVLHSGISGASYAAYHQTKSQHALDGSAFIVNLETGDKVRIRTNRFDTLESFLETKAGEVILAARGQDGIRLFDAKTGRIRTTLSIWKYPDLELHETATRLHTTLYEAADGSLLIGFEKRANAGSRVYDETVVFNTTTKKIARFEYGVSLMNYYAAPDNAGYFAYGLVERSKSRDVVVKDLTANEEHEVFRATLPKGFRFPREADEQMDMLQTRSGRKLMAFRAGTKVVVYDLATAKPILISLEEKGEGVLRLFEDAEGKVKVLAQQEFSRSRSRLVIAEVDSRKVSYLSFENDLSEYEFGLVPAPGGRTLAIGLRRTAKCVVVDLSSGQIEPVTFPEGWRFAGTYTTAAGTAEAFFYKEGKPYILQLFGPIRGKR